MNLFNMGAYICTWCACSGGETIPEIKIKEKIHSEFKNFCSLRCFGQWFAYKDKPIINAWRKCSDNLPTANEKVIIYYELFGKKHNDIAKFVQYKDVYNELRQEWLIYPSFSESVNAIATLRNVDILYWHPIQDLP